MGAGPRARTAVVRAADRFRTVGAGLDTRHSFSFGDHYDPANTGFGLLVAFNEDRIAPGAGYGRHHHRDVEIVTWLLAGCLEHHDSTGTRHLLRPGQVQLLSAGSGVWHSERNAAPAPAAELDAPAPAARRDAPAPPDTLSPVHMVQMWVRSAGNAQAPSYDTAAVDPASLRGQLVPVVSGPAGHALTAGLPLRQPGATLLVATLGAEESVKLPEAPAVHVFVASGEVDVDGVGALAAGDALRLSHETARRVEASRARPAAGVDPSDQPALLLVWQMYP